MEYGHESEVQSLLKELIIMKARISKLLEQARQGLHTIKDAKIEMENQFKRIEEQKEQIAKLDHWLDTINTELNVSTKQSEVLTEEDIIRYIEIYERYIRQYEEYEIILKSITVISVDESSQSMQMKLNALKKTLEESRVLVIAEIERLRQILINIKYTADAEEDVSQTDRTIDSTSMPEEIVSQKIIETVEVPSEHIKIVPEDDARFESEHVDETIEEIKSPKIVESKITTTIETQTGKSLISEAPSVHDKSVICQPEIIETQDVSITCAPPKEVEVQTSEQKSEDGELLENIQVKQTTSDGHETIIISSRPVVREKAIDETSLLVDADYEGDNQIKNSELNITHSIPQSFETVMVEPDETTTEVVVDADGTKRIIVRKVRKTLVTRQQVLHTQERSSHVFSESDAHRDHTFQQITLQEDQGSTSRTFDDGGIQNIQYQTYGGQVITGLPGREMTIQEFTSKPEMVISMGQDMNPDQILQIAEGKIQPEIQTSSSSVTAVVEQVTKRIIRTRRRIIRRVVIIDGKEHVSEEIIEEPDDVEVSEEQIPRVSINIMDRNIPIVKDDLDDDNKRPPDDRDPNLDDKKDSDIVEDKNKPLDFVDDDAKSESHVIQEAKDDSVPEHDSSIQEHESISSQLLLSGNEVTQLETSSSHFATLTQKVTRTITRTKKRIIKHIQIIDGKEHVTEEVIEEPADVEILELEPEETRVTLDEGTKMKRVKIIRQVQIIDGKEHVTEKIIDEGDDTSEPEISTGSNEEPSYHQEYVVSEPEQSQFTTGDNVADLTSSLIASEINYTLMSEQKGKRELVEETVDDKKRDLPSTKQPTDTNEYATKLEIAEEVDKDSHKDISPESTQKRLFKPEESIQKDALPKTTELTSSDNETNDKMLKEQTHVDIPVVGIQDLPKESVIREQVSDVSVPEESVVSLGDKRWESTIGTSSTVTEGFSTVTNRHVTRIRRRVIRRIQVIDGKEHVTEEVIEEPEEVTIEPETFTIQEEGVKTRRIRIIRNVQIIDGKEHVTEQIVEDPDGEYVPDSTLTANIDVKIGPYEKSLLVTETVENEDPIKDTLQNAEQKPQELPSSLEMTKGFIDREKEHTVSTVTIPSNQLSTKEDITEMTTQPQPDSENLAKEPKSKEVVSPPTDLETANSTIVQVEQNVDVHDTAHTRDLYVTDVLTPSDINIDSSVRTQEEDVLSKTQSVPQVITKTRDSEIDDVVPQLLEIATAAPAILPEDKKSEAEEVIIQDNQLHTIDKINMEETQKNSLRDVTKSLIDSETSHVFELDSSKSIRIDKDLQAGSVEAKPKVEVGLPGETVSTTEASICSVIVKDVQNAPIKESLLESSKSESKPVKNDNISNAESDTKKTSILDATKSFLGMESEHSSINLKVTEIKTDQPQRQTSIPDDTNTDIINNVNETPVEIQSDDNKSIIISKDEVSQRDVEEILSPVDSKGTVDVDLPRQDVTNTLQDKNILIPKTEDTVSIIKSESLISPKDEVEVFNEELDQKISSQIPVTKDSSVSGKDHNIIIRDNKDSEFVGCQIQEQDGDIKCIKIIKQKVLIGDQEHSTEEIVEVPTDDSLPKSDLTTQIDLSISKTRLQENVVSETSIDLIPVVSPTDTISVGNTIDFITSEAAHTSQLLNLQNDLTEKPRSIENLEKEVERPSKSADREPEQSQIEVTDLKDITTATEKYSNEPIKVTISESDSIIIPTFKNEFDGVVNKDESTQKDTQILSHMTVDAGVSQTTVDVTPIHTESPMTEVDIAVQPATSEVSYIKQFQPQETTRDEPQQTACDKYSEITSITIPVPDSKAEITKFIDLERHDTHLRDLMVTAPENKAIQTNVPKDDTHLSTAQTVDVFMSIEKNDNINQTVPSVQLDLKVESSDQEIPSIVKKDVDVILPADVKITKEPVKQQFVETEPVPEPLTQLPKASETPEEKEKVKKKPKKNKKQKRTSECSDSVEIDLHTETDRTINDTESSSLGHYVELPVSPHHDSPKPTESVVQTSILQEAELETSPVSTISVIEDKGYEPEDISLCPTPSPDKRKRGKRRKPQITSEITTYPKQQTTDEITIISSSVDTDDDFRQLKNTDSQEKDENDIMKYPEQEETKPLEKAELSEIISSETISNSPKEESCHTISDASDVSTVKIVEECVTGSPEMVRDKITTTVTYPVPVVEEIFTQEYSVQTSPETVPDLAVPDTEKVVAVPPTETADTNLQTSPTPVDEVFVQTLPKEDKEVHTQTISIETLNVQDSEIQTSRINTPDVITQSEAMTQVIPHDVSYLEEKNLQTSPITEFEENAVSEVSPIDFESIEIQTSPWPQIQKDEKGTETTVETIDTNVQTLQPQIVDQETFTSLENISELIESGVQTSDVITTSKFTQSDDASPVEQEYPGVRMDKELITLPLDHEEQKTITFDYSQQTSPTLMETLDHQSPIQIENIVKVDNAQQTSPRVNVEETTHISDKINTVLSDKTQQTTPRDYPEDVIADMKKDVSTTDRVQQTSPRVYSDDSISTSTDEPYEIHLRAQISIPQATDDFINNERQIQEAPQSISGDKSKPKKRRHKKKTETSLHSPGSLSDPINAELSISVTPTSEDLSSRETTSIDEGISQITSPVVPPAQQFVAQPKLTYSDVVQRSKSKSPSPSKTIIPSMKSEKARLINSLEKRTQSMTEPQRNVSEDSLAVALIEPSMEKSYDLIINKELNELQTAIELIDNTKTEKSILIVIETISIWLEEIQYKIQIESVTQTKVSDKSERLKELQNHVQNLKEILFGTEVNEEVITLIETLTRQVEAVKNLSSNSSVKVKEVENEWGKFLEDTEMLSLSIERVKMRLDDMIILELSVQQKLDELDNVELENIDNTDTVRKLFRRFRSIVEVNPKRECPLKLYTCDEDTKQIENSINTERDRLMQLMSLAEEYEQTLQDFGHITDVAEALLDGKIIVSDLEHLHEEIQKHRKFFVNLSHCRAILESLEDNLDSETRAKFSSLHNSLHDRATKIIDRAAGRAQQMTLAASRWSVLDHGMKDEQQWLRVAHQRIPDLTNVTSMDHEQYINLYQSISLDVSHHYAKMLRLLSITESLQNLIVCSGLETECSIALSTLLTLQDDIDSRLTRLRAFKENWMTYEHLINRVESWMALANRELENITPDNITTTANLRRFWELKAQHEVHLNLKNESGVQFEKALEILPISDEMVQREFFMKIEDKWRELAASIGDLHATAIQNISDRDVSSGEKLHILEEELRELRASLDSLKGVIKSEDELNLYIERLQVMTGRIDRIQNELGRLSLLPTAESDRLGVLLGQSGTLDDQIAEELERSMILKEKIVQVQAGILRCQKNQQRARLTLEECQAAEGLGSDVVERASETCRRLLDDLVAQWRDILALRQALHTLPISLRVTVSPTGVEKDISALQETHAELEAACNELCLRLRSRAALWRRFERQLELVQGAVREADYMAELLTVQGQVDYDRLLKATEKLETLSESLSRRSGELVGELREAAAPLEAGAEPAVAAQLRRDMDDAAAAYEHTCANLAQMCDKYQKAVELWRRYRDAASAVRAFAESQEGRLHALRPADAPAAAQACLEQEARVTELRSLAARVAAETGSRALQADADALARRLQLVAGAVRALADLGEARDLALAKAHHAKDKFCDMKQDLAPVHEESEIVEDKLIALRDNLIALGKSEADIAPAKAELPEIDRDVSEEHSIVRILELWQAMFRDTFLHYHRLSTALVRSGDAATALKLWHEYLLDLQSFLSGSVPTDYENLTEHRRLCRVHRNLLASQRSVLINENKETTNRELADKFDTLTNLHNETLARIVERHDEVCTRIAAWDDYREIYTELLRWLKEIEREKEKLQLRYVHIKRVHKILSKIQNLSDKLPEGRMFADKLSVYLKRVLVFTDDTYGASVRMEYAGIVKRVDNLQASLDTWRDFLTRILGLIGEYENLSGELHKLYSRTQDEIMSYSDDDRLSRPQIKKAIEKYTETRKKIDKTENQIEALSVIQEQLKECLSPQDIRIVNQKVWQMRQQRADLEHQLSIIIHRLQERLEVYTIFTSRITRFSEWMTTVESRLDTSSSSNDVSALDPQDLIRKINSDIHAETSLKEREFEWLSETGSTLVELSKKDEKSFSKNVSKQLKDVQDRWQRLQETGRSRIAKINELLETISQLEERLTEIRLKLHSIESKLTASVIIENLTTKAVDEKFQNCDEIHKSIEHESGEVGETLNLCELVFNDPDVLSGNFDLRNLRTGVDIVDKKWKNICEMSEHRKNSLKEIRKSAELANSLLPKVEKKLDGIEKRVEKVEIRKQRGDVEDDSVSKAAIKDLDALEEDMKRLEDAYSRIASTRGVELRGGAAEHAGRLRTAARRWRQLRARLAAAGTDLQRQFVAAHGSAVVALAEADVRLTRALHLAPTPADHDATLKELDGVEAEIRECRALVAEADRLEAALAGAGGSAALASEYRALLQDVTTRLDLARSSLLAGADVDSAVQVDTLTWETDAALQVDTLTSKETYSAELAAAVRETSDALEALRAALQYDLKEDASGDEMATAAKEIAKAGAKPGQTLELAKHLSELLLTECDATEDEAMLKEVESLSLRYEDLLTQAKKRELQINNLRLPHSASYALTCEHESGRLTCPLCSDRNWKQLDNDLWRLEQWLQFAEATDEARTDPPHNYDALEDAIQDHREFLLDLDSHKALVVSLNVVGAHVAQHAREPAAGERARARLAAANARWDAACARAAAWQTRLQHALVHNQQFHDIVEELVGQLSEAEACVRSREPLRLRRAPAELRADFRRFSELRDELARAEPRVQALRDAAALLHGADSQHVCRRLGELRLRLQSLRKLSAVYALKLGAALARHPAAGTTLAAAAAALAPQLLEEEEEQMSLGLPPLSAPQAPESEESEAQCVGRVQRGLRFVCRVARASLPFQALLLLLLGAAALAPHNTSPHACGPALALDPVLRYPDGPPPL